MENYKKGIIVKYNDNLYQTIIREDNKYGFLKIVVDGDSVKYETPTAMEFLKLSSLMNKDNKIKF